MNPFSAPVPEYIRSLVPYLPGKPIEETQREFGLKRVVKLASNENPLGPSPKARVAVSKAIQDLHRYPDGSGYALKQVLSKKLKVNPSQLILGNGSNEIIDFVVRTFCLPGDEVVTSKAAFIAYKIGAQVHGVRTIETPLTQDLRFDLPAMAREISKNAKIRIAFIANPNNPTGTYVKTQELVSFLEEVARIRAGTTLVVLDYAYWEYVTAKDLPDPMELLKKYPNVLVLRTFSKVYGLAGLRVGYGIAAPEMIQSLEKVREPFNLNSLALTGAVAALGDNTFVKRARTVNLQGLKFWEKSLNELKVPYWKSQGNFLLIDAQAGFGKSGVELYQTCLSRGVIFRPVANYGLPGLLRISVGTPSENRFALMALKREFKTS